MFEIWEAGEPATRLGDAGSVDAAFEQLDTECRRRHDQAVANGEGTQGMRHRFEIRDQAARPVAWLVYSPDTSRPYDSVITDEMIEWGQL